MATQVPGQVHEFCRHSRRSALSIMPANLWNICLSSVRPLVFDGWTGSVSLSRV